MGLSKKWKTSNISISPIFSISFTKWYITTWPIYNLISVQNKNKKNWLYRIVLVPKPIYQPIILVYWPIFKSTAYDISPVPSQFHSILLQRVKFRPMYHKIQRLATKWKLLKSMSFFNPKLIILWHFSNSFSIASFNNQTGIPWSKGTSKNVPKYLLSDIVC